MDATISVDPGWRDAIEYMAKEAESNPDDAGCQLLWKRLQLGHRTTDLLQTIQAKKKMRDDVTSQSPEWNGALKWLAYQRAQATNLMIEMIWEQVERGTRTPELLHMIRSVAQAPPAPAPPAPEAPPAPAPPAPEPPPVPEDNTIPNIPPSPNF